MYYTCGDHAGFNLEDFLEFTFSRFHLLFLSGLGEMTYATKFSSYKMFNSARHKSGNINI